MTVALIVCHPERSEGPRNLSSALPSPKIDISENLQSAIDNLKFSIHQKLAPRIGVNFW